ncbi:MAG: hypothetical protein OK442_06905 [Thaumarchaeota archaeon]|nr:hypothetical protein [Nitrososphaerota archaeon]
MARKAVAATLASVVLLTVLVVADATVLSAQDNLASSAQTSYLESREVLLEESLAGGVSLQVLAQVQGYLSSNPAECDNLPEYLSSISASGTSSGEDSGIAYAANAGAVEVPGNPLVAPDGDNLTIVAPFAGWPPGVLHLSEVLSVREVGGGGSVSLERQETHDLNIPVEVDSVSSLCAATLGSLGAALSRSPCNSTLEQAAFDAVLPGLVADASALHFTLTAGWGSGAACSATYWVTLVEPGVAGPAGSFDWTVRGSGTTT